MAKQQIMSEKSWYVIHTYSGYEEAVAKNLKQRIESLGMEDKIFNVIVPKEKKNKNQGRQTQDRGRENLSRLHSGGNGRDRRFLVCGEKHSQCDGVCGCGNDADSGVARRDCRFEETDGNVRARVQY